MTHPLNGDLECWRAPQSPFQILYSRLTLEQIRLAVVDAYFLVPRGGLEIGGILLGKHRDRQIEIFDHEPLDCEHAVGPSFSLSPRDHARLLAKVRRRAGGLQPVGWYHSHTRSEICLTDADLDIHDRYFPEMWQVALVLRPSISQPARAGFFFREQGGAIRASASYHEFQLEPLGSAPTLLKTDVEARARVAAAAANPRPSFLEPILAPAVSKPPREPSVPVSQAGPLPRSLMPGGDPQPPQRLPSHADVPAARVVRRVVEPLPALAPAAQPKTDRQVTPITDHAAPQKLPAPTESSPEPLVAPTPIKRPDPASQVELPRFLRNEPPPKGRWTQVPLFIASMLFLAVALGGFALVARDTILPRLRPFMARFSAAPAAGAPLRGGPAMSIKALDDLGQLEIRWDASATSVRAARSGVLSIADGGPPQPIPLDAPHLLTGAFTYKRHGARVDARLSILTADGTSVEAATTFLGPPPVEEAEPVPSKLSAAALAKQNAELRRQLDEQIARNKTLQAQLERLRKQRGQKTGQ